MTSGPPNYSSSDTRSAHQAILRGLAWVSALFSFAVVVLVFATFAQLQRTPPLSSPALQALIAQYRQNPEDTQVQAEVRALDLLARKAYFTSEWQLRVGGWLLLAGVMVFVLVTQALRLLQPPRPAPPGCPGVADPWVAANRARHWLTGAAACVALLAILLAFTVHPPTPAGGGVRERPLPVVAATVPHPLPAALPGPLKAPETAPTVADPVPTNPVPAPTAGQPEPTTVAPVPAAEFANNWPAFRGAFDDGTVRQATLPDAWDGPSGKGILWKVPVPRAGFNSPIVWGERVFLAGADKDVREVFCFAAADGKLLWRREVKGVAGSPTEAPAVSNDTGFAAPTMATDGRRVFAIFANGDLAALDFDGKPLWSQNLGTPKNHYGHSSSLLAFRDLLFVQFDQGDSPRVTALHAADGSQAWEATRDVDISWASPLLVTTSTDPVLVLAAAPRVVAYNADTGVELWRTDCLSGEVAPSPAVGAGLVFVANEYAKLTALDLKSGAVKWQTEDASLPNVASPVANDKYLFLAAGNGTVTCLAAVGGKILWTKEFDKGFYASPLLAGERVYVTDMAGMTIVFKAGDSYVELGRSVLGEDVVTTPACAGGRFYVRAAAHLYCIGSKDAIPSGK